MTNIYSEIYNLIIGLFGDSLWSSALSGAFASFAVLFVILVPFIILLRVVRLISGG